MKNNPIIIRKIYQVSVDKVWKALTDKKQIKEWYFTIDDFELKEGAEFNFYVSIDDTVFHHRCVIKEIISQKRLSHTWTHPTQSKGESILTWELCPVREGTELILTHVGVENFADGGEMFKRENYVEGWEDILGTSLMKFLSK